MSMHNSGVKDSVWGTRLGVGSNVGLKAFTLKFALYLKLLKNESINNEHYLKEIKHHAR